MIYNIIYILCTLDDMYNVYYKNESLKKFYTEIPPEHNIITQYIIIY